MARSFGIVREDGSKDGVRYSISGSEAEAMAHLLFCVYSIGFICLLSSQSAVLHFTAGKQTSFQEKYWSESYFQVNLVRS